MSKDQGKLQDAFLLHQQGKLVEAAAIYEQLIQQNATNYEALHFLGTIKAVLGQFNEAKQLIERSLASAQTNIAYIENYVAILFQICDYEQAVQICSKAIKENRKTENLQYILAASLYKLGRLKDAVFEFDSLLLSYPNHLAGNNEKASVLAELNQYDEALSYVEKALRINPRYAVALLNKGNILAKQKKYVESISAYKGALSLNGNLADAHLGCGNVFRELKHYDEALAAYDRALALNPDADGAWLGRGNVFTELKHYEEALAAYDRALALKPDLSAAEGARLYTKMHICEWINFDTECAHLISSIRNKKANVFPFAFLGIPSSCDDQLECAKLWVADNCPPSQKPIWRGEHYRHDRIRIAYVSADFREHPVSHLIAGMFEAHDKSRFDVTAISFGPDHNSEMRQRLKASVERFIDAEIYSDDQVANFVRSSEVDILVDLMGFTAGSRTGIFARRPAPVQVNYLGYSGTMGASYIDYIIADQTVIPDEFRKFYSEKIAVLPNTYQASDRKRVISDKVLTRSDVGLPSQGFVFCCFNNSFKVIPRVFDCWMRILKQVKGSVLWLSEHNPSTTGNLKKEAVARGISPERLVFAKHMPLLSEHLARHKLADVFLDTLPYNAHTTASDALWAGLPVLTCLGEMFAGRVAASLLNAIHLPELITTTLEAYEQMAINLATHPEKLAAIKHKLAENRLTTPLFDTKLFTKHIEAAYIAMYERHQDGLALDHIVIPN